MEEARAYKYLIDKFNLTQEKLSEILGKARVTVTNTLRLLNLPQEIQDEIKKGRLSFAHGRALLEVQDYNQLRRLVQETISKSLSVSELENLIKRQRGGITKHYKETTLTTEPYVAVLQEELQQILATKVRINKRKKRGQIIIEFYSSEELERIADKIRGVK
jgi:ParB family chromosome partitioning protein